MELEFLKDSGFNIVKTSKYLYNLKTIDKDGDMLRYKYNSRTDALHNLITREEYPYGFFKLLEMASLLDTDFKPNASRMDSFKREIIPMLEEMEMYIVEVQKDAIYVIIFQSKKGAIIYRPNSDTYQVGARIVKGIRNFLY